MPGIVWTIMIAVTAAEAGVILGVGYGLWQGLGADEREFITPLLAAQAGMLILGAIALLATAPVALLALHRRYIAPLRPMAEDSRVIAVSNPRHRLAYPASDDLKALVDGINLLAERYQALNDEVDSRVREANATVAEERNTLAALISKLTQGVLVCNPEGRILLYNQLAQVLLEGTTRQGGSADWIGLGRSIFGVFDEEVVRHSLTHVLHRLADGAASLMVPFVAARPGGQVLSVHLVPILDDHRELRGYLLTIEDITRRSGHENRRGVILESLMKDQRSRIASIRAAIEIVLAHDDMSPATLQQFLDVIRDEAMGMSERLDQLEHVYSAELKTLWPVEQTLASDFLATCQRRITDNLQMEIEATAPINPVWLRVDSYALVQCLIFLVDRVRRFCRPTALGLHLETRGSLAAVVLEWSGAHLDTEALRLWGTHTVVSQADGASLSLFEVIERHAGAIWSHSMGGSRRPGVHLVLPMGEAQALTGAGGVDSDPASDFDFRLFAERPGGDALDRTPLDLLSCTVIDTETTGLEPEKGDEIIAIAAVRIVHGRVLHREIFDSFVNPRRPVSEAAQAIHGISTAMLRGMPTIEEVLPRLSRFVEDTVIVGHNVDFDMTFFRAKEERTGVRFRNPVLDTLLLEQIVHPNQDAKSLEAIAGRLGIDVKGRHTALGDALTTAEIFLALLPVLADRGIRTLAEAREACATQPTAWRTP
jgi:DNA polymerase-3 subunit epsilon